MTDRYAVFGNPIAHSKSPAIHQRFAEQTQQALTYEALLAPVDQFAESFQQFLQQQGRGANVTVPFKQEAFALAEQLTPRAQRAGAVNTLWQDAQGVVHGDTTDGIGLVRDLIHNHNLSLKDKRILILGAGGAVRGVIEPILAEHPAQLVIANRTLSKAQELVPLFAEFGSISACGFDELEGQQFDLVINGTAASLAGELPPLPDQLLAQGAACYDMMYGKAQTVFNRWAVAHGAVQAIDGLGMLVEQAAEAFQIWRGVKPNTQLVIAELRAALNS
ncbi:shikimate dehydrogenase [Oceanospirillum multiglobuliferum]|uniref:Shikimate dehydrogenase (NADP(+)) n=2 Tax=Oceanospirillum multiglobuliferum TaxID=64969 RepID=A0A1T4NQ10_9GAMM|nr:shikimate dehydrogenase [Oceanospirillum multiglobuliferum]OPX55718.1 shikimate dehydrogenase [Oceanospirillum multiglobuliferum]SJZ81314.1 shikimate dehydrogenase [Oceanospirillum multiglobuliferum]